MTTKYSKEEIERILEDHSFEYQKVALPYGLQTPGADRSDTLSLVYPESLEGRSVLDIGSANGFFCFEAEARGARRVVGVEIKEKRYKASLVIKDILGSHVEFICRDILDTPLNERFDYVLLLNLIHHLKEPFRALRSFAQLALECMIIEFPTFADKKFRMGAGIRVPWPYDRLPLVGVSSLKDPHIDQTFVFTKGAIERVLLDHEPLFKRIQFKHSPMQGRLIATCFK